MRHDVAARLILSLCLGGCPDDAKRDGDTSPGPGDATTSETSDGASTDAALDVPDGSGGLDGTPLEGVRVVWGAPLVLCDAWVEGASRAEALAHRVRVTLPPQARVGLSLDALGAATLEGAYVERGPFEGERWWPTDVASRAPAGDYLVRVDDTSMTLTGRIVHDLGDAGALAESYVVTRGGGVSGDVVVDALAEIGFAWSPGAGQAYHPLERCAVPEGFEDAVEVLVARQPASGGLTATVLRFYTTRHAEVSAGSYPVRWHATQLVLSDMPWSVVQASGPWAQTYVAQHHNLSEASVVDLERDLAGWQTTFAPLAAGEPIREGSVGGLSLDGIGGGGQGTVTLTRLGTTGARTTTVLDAGPSWRRVDAEHLGRHYAGACAAPAIDLVGFSEHTAQLVVCPDAGGPEGKRLVGVVPVVWSGDPERAGELLDKDAITARAGGWTVTVGVTTLKVDPQADDAYIIDILDARGESLGSSYATLSALVPAGGWDAPVDASGAAGGDEVRVLIDRKWAAQGIGESSIYAVASVKLTWGERVWKVDAWDRIRYTNTHHNWQDTLAATSDDGHVIRWTITYDFMNGEGLVQRVWVDDADGGEVLGETIVTPRATEE